MKLRDPELNKQLEDLAKQYDELPDWMKIGDEVFPKTPADESK